MKLRHLVLVCVMLAACEASAQATAERWRIVTTPHFRVHYPAEYEAWTLRAASRLEAIRAAVVLEVGYEPPQTIDVVIGNPQSEPNGLAWPLLGAPRVVFYAEPPDADEQLGEHGEWSELLAVHEIAHIVHLTRRSRNPLQRLAERLLLPVGPIPLSAPRWVIEGYATVIEGRLTGMGRPSSSMRAAVLRKWAREGRLPSYSQLNSDQRFLGMSMAYLAGSAFLEWLEARNGEGSLRHLWARMTARERRSFNVAFEGTFSETPQRLYGLFCAELTASAVTIARSAPLFEGSLWQETHGASGEPALAPDGLSIALVIRARELPARLVVLGTDEATAEETRRSVRIARILSRDPEDVAPVFTKPVDRSPLFQLVLPDGGTIGSPRWIADASGIVFTRKTKDRDGDLHNDLAFWHLRSGRVVNVTREADISDADIAPDTRTAIAVRNRFGSSQLVTVDLGNGQVAPLTEPSAERIYNHPRISGDGKRLVYVMHRDGQWRVIVRELLTREETEIGAGQANLSSPEWARDRDGDILAAAAAGGFLDLVRLRPGVAPMPLTRVLGAAISPAQSRDGRLFFMSLEPDGFTVRVVASSADPVEPRISAGLDLVPAVPPSAPPRVPFATQTDLNSQRYGIGRQEMAWLAGATVAPHSKSIEAGVRFGDVVGRLDTLILASIGNGNGIDGATLAAAWRGWPVELGGQLYGAKQGGIEMRGADLHAAWRNERALSMFEVRGGVHHGERDDEDRNFAFADASWRGWRLSGTRRIVGALEVGASRGDVVTTRGQGRVSVKAAGLRGSVAFTRAHSMDGTVLAVGGTNGSILPAAALPDRIEEAAFDLNLLDGNRYEGRRFELASSSLPVTLFWQQHRLWFNSDGVRRRMRVAGLEATFDSEAQPLLRLPGLSISAGVARLLDEPLRDDTSLWLTLRWRP